MTQNKVYVTLFHASWCGHCKDFLPTWDEIKKTESTKKSFVFAEYESKEIPDGDEGKINGNEIQGFPTLKIVINEEEYEYDGERNLSGIVDYVLSKLKKIPPQQEGGCGCNEQKQQKQQQKGGCACDAPTKQQKGGNKISSIIKNDELDILNHQNTFTDEFNF